MICCVCVCVFISPRTIFIVIFVSLNKLFMCALLSVCQFSVSPFKLFKPRLLTRHFLSFSQATKSTEAYLKSNFNKNVQNQRQFRHLLGDSAPNGCARALLSIEPSKADLSNRGFCLDQKDQETDRIGTIQ